MGYSVTVNETESYLSKRLSHEEEILLLRQRDNKKSLDTLVLANMGLVHKLTHKFPIKNSSCSYEDLFQEGIAGLIHAIKKFDLKRGYRLSTYAYRWIQAYLTRYYQNHGKTIRIPVHMNTSSMSLNKTVERLTQELGRVPTESEIAECCPNVNDIRYSMMDVSSLNQLMGDGGEELECLQGEDCTEDVDTALTCDILLDRLKDEVSERDYDIFMLRYGFGGYDPHSLKEVAAVHDLTRARIYQIEKDCVDKMKQMVSVTD